MHAVKSPKKPKNRLKSSNKAQKSLKTAKKQRICHKNHKNAESSSFHSSTISAENSRTKPPDREGQGARLSAIDEDVNCEKHERRKKEKISRADLSAHGGDAAS